MQAERGVMHAEAICDAGINATRRAKFGNREMPVLIGAHFCANMFGRVFAELAKGMSRAGGKIGEFLGFRAAAIVNARGVNRY